MPNTQLEWKSSVRYYVIHFIKTLTVEQRKKLKEMLNNDIDCCRGIADIYNISADEFKSELKDIMEGN